MRTIFCLLILASSAQAGLISTVTLDVGRANADGDLEVSIFTTDEPVPEGGPMIHFPPIDEVDEMVSLDFFPIPTVGPYIDFNHAMTNGEDDWELMFLAAGTGPGMLKTNLFTNQTTTNGIVIASDFTPPNGIDLAGYHLTLIEVTANSIVPQGSSGRSNITVRWHAEPGEVPEPTSMVLAFVGLCLVHVITPRHR